MSQKSNKLGIVVILLALSVVALGVLLYLRSEQNHELTLEKQSLTQELDHLKEDLLAQLGENDSLNNFVELEVARLSAIIDSINTVNVDNKKLMTSYRNKVYQLKSDNKALVARLDSLNDAYAALRLREQMVADSLANALMENSNLSQENTGLRETVKQGKQLVATGFQLEAVRIARNGRERKTRRASKADRLKVCFTVPENKIAPRGSHTFYVRWFDSKGKPVDAPGSNLAIVGGQEGGFNGKTNITYMGTEVRVCIDAERAEDAPIDLPDGMYTVAIYTDEYLMGTGAVELK